MHVHGRQHHLQNNNMVSLCSYHFLLAPLGCGPSSSVVRLSTSLLRNKEETKGLSLSEKSEVK